jgi:uroporphyrinogen-III synthase
MPFAVLTRDPLDAAAYSALLVPLGLEVVAMPVTRTHPPADPSALGRALADGRYDAIVVASPRAAHALARAAAEHAIELPEVWAVGAATKRALDIEHVAAVAPADVVDGAGLARAVVAARSLAGKRVLVPRAEDGRDEPLEILRAAGAEVVAVVAYKTIAMAPDDPRIARGVKLLLGAGAAVTCVFAPSQVAALAEVVRAYMETPLMPMERGTELVFPATLWCAIGETTGQALRDAGVDHVAVAATPTPEGMARAVASVYPVQGTP